MRDLTPLEQDARRALNTNGRCFAACDHNGQQPGLRIATWPVDYLDGDQAEVWCRERHGALRLEAVPRWQWEDTDKAHLGDIMRAIGCTVDQGGYSLPTTPQTVHADAYRILVALVYADVLAEAQP